MTVSWQAPLPASSASKRQSGRWWVSSSCDPKPAIVQFVLRELAHPTAALDTIYDGVFEPTHRRFCELWAEATGEDPESDGTKIVVFTMIGQVVYFRIGREAVMRRMGWSETGPKEADAIASVAVDNLAAILCKSA